MYRIIQPEAVCNDIDSYAFMQIIIRFSLLQIYGASTASYGKKVSSTYLRYACGTFLPISLYLHRLFAKGFIQNGQGCIFFDVSAGNFRSGTDGIVQEYASLHILELQVFLTKNSRLFGTTDILSVRDVLPNGKTRVFR